MADSLIGNVSGTYYRNLFKLTGRNNTVKVIVEDELDIPFWYDLFNTISSHRTYRITPYTYSSNGANSTKGKVHILDLARNQQLNQYYWGCVDSDYDYLLSDISNDGQLMYTNSYILQTYAYSIENLLCCAETLEGVCTKANKVQPTFNIVNYIHTVSEIIYPLLIWSLYLESKGLHDFTVTQWRNILPCDRHIFSSQDSADKILHDIRIKVVLTLYDIEKNHKSETDLMQIFEKRLQLLYGVKPENCYLFVRGHDFFNFVLRAILEGIQIDSRRSHRSELKNISNHSKEVGDLQSHYTNICSETKDVLETNYEYKHKCPMIFDKIKADILYLDKRF